MCGWALASFGRPWVAQRVWPTPTVPASDSPLFSRSARRESLPSALLPVSEPLRVDHGDAGAIVSAILQASEGIEDDRNAIALADVTNDPAHTLLQADNEGLHYLMPSLVRW